MTVSEIKPTKTPALKEKKDVSTSNNESEYSRTVQEIEGIAATEEVLVNGIKGLGIKEKLEIPKADQKKFNINEEDIISERADATTHTYVLKDGRIVTYKKDENNKLTLYQINKNNKLAKIERTEYYDERGNVTITITYEYDENGILKSTNRINIVENITQLTEYSKESVKETTIDADGKVLRVTTKELNDKGVDEKKIVEDYYYNEQGQKIMATAVDEKTGKESTSFYNEQGQVLMTFPFNIISENLSEDNNIKEKGYDGFYDYRDRTRLGQQITEVLTPKEIEEINQKINQNVDSAGRGTGEGVAAALTTLITEFQNKGIMLPYFAGGEHEPTAGINTEWGKAGLDSSQTRNRKSGDCTGIIAWAIETAGINCPDDVSYEAETEGKRITCDEIKPGTILAFGVGLEGHDILVVNTYTDAAGKKHLVCAQSKGGGVNGETGAKPNDDGDSTGGVVLTDYTYEIGKDVTDIKNNTGQGIVLISAYAGGEDTNTYGIYDMEDYYKNNSK